MQNQEDKLVQIPKRKVEFVNETLQPNSTWKTDKNRASFFQENENPPKIPKKKCKILNFFFLFSRIACKTMKELLQFKNHRERVPSRKQAGSWHRECLRTPLSTCSFLSSWMLFCFITPQQFHRAINWINRKKKSERKENVSIWIFDLVKLLNTYWKSSYSLPYAIGVSGCAMNPLLISIYYIIKERWHQGISIFFFFKKCTLLTYNSIVVSMDKLQMWINNLSNNKHYQIFNSA